MTTKTFKRIDVAAARELLARGNVQIFDSRGQALYDLAHIGSARRLSSDNLDMTLLRTPKDAPVLLYCYHGNASQTYGQMFADFDFSEVYSLDGGFAAWQRAQGAGNAPAVSAALAQWLSKHGYPADSLDTPTEHGMTPLMRAAKSGEIGVIFELIQAGAQLATTNMDGNNALWLACVGASIDIIELLIRAGIDVNHQNDTGATCLMYAASTGKHAVVEKLLNAGADTTLKTQDDFTALDMAANIECLNLLRGVEKELVRAIE